MSTPVKRARHRERLINEIGIETVLEAIEEGKLLTHIARELQVSYGALLDVLAMEEHKAAVAEAKRRGATAHAEKAVDEAVSETDPKAAGLAKLRADMYRWLAAKRDPATYGDNKQLTVSGTLEHAHLHALAMERGTRRAGESDRPPARVALEVPHEVVEAKSLPATTLRPSDRADAAPQARQPASARRAPKARK